MSFLYHFRDSVLNVLYAFPRSLARKKIMGTVTSAKLHLSKMRCPWGLKETKRRDHRRWLVIWNAFDVPAPAREIVIDADVSVSTTPT